LQRRAGIRKIEANSTDRDSTRHPHSNPQSTVGIH